MIHIKVTAKGESDAAPIGRTFDYDEPVLFAAADKVAEKARLGLKINVDEVLMFYSAYVVMSVRNRTSDEDIRKGVSKLLSGSDVMIGVPETLQTVMFEATSDNGTRRLAVSSPISTSRYILQEH